MPGTIGRYCEVCVLRLCKVVWVFCGMAWILHGDIMSEMLIMYAGHGNCSGGQAIEPMPVPQTATRPRKRSDGSPPNTRSFHFPGRDIAVFDLRSGAAAGLLP